jgi:putative transposase
MKRSKLSDSEIIDAVKRVESGIGVPDICRELGLSSATFFSISGGPNMAAWMCP